MRMRSDQSGMEACSHCGASARYEHCIGMGKSVQYIYCENRDCGIRTPYITDTQSQDAGVVFQIWNRRPSDDPDALHTLKEALEIMKKKA